MTNTLSRRGFLGTSILAGLGSSLLPRLWAGQTKGGNDFSFVFMADIHVKPEQGATEGFKKAIEKINALRPRPDFAIAGGDLVMDVLETDYKRADMLYNLYQDTSRLLEMPLCNVIGNHECFGVYPKSGVEISHPEYGKKMFMKRLGDDKTYRSFDWGDWHFMLLDSVGLPEDERIYIGHIDPQQMEWIRADLESVGKERPVAIATHIPFVTNVHEIQQGPTSGNSNRLVVTNGHEVAKILYDYNVKLILQGHLHVNEEWIFMGKHFREVGAVSGHWWKGPHHGHPEGFAVITTRGNDFRCEYMTYGWKAQV